MVARLHTKREKIERVWSTPECRAVLEACGFKQSATEEGRLEMAMGDEGARRARVAVDALGIVVSGIFPMAMDIVIWIRQLTRDCNGST